MDMRQKGRNALVTGAGHGIGAAIARRLAAEGARVMVTDRDQKAAAETVAAIVGAGGTAAARRMDVTARAEVESAVAALAADWGRLDVLVSNAGVMDRAPFLEMTDEFWHRVLEINLYGTFLCGQVAARQMAAQGGGGRIVHVASNSGIFGGRGRAAYGASKAGIINLTQTMAIELAEFGILVNAVAPGPTRTRDDQPTELWPSVAARMPLNRFAHPDEIAAVAAFLASGDCSFTTGHVYCADGGFTISGILE
jgi:3-oxoacyl-[acyl-carrier protein] reductase